ncbi:MAG: hypothetical protein K2P93_01445 [Alphaproteobacteria bacterium]|nr:hypothetical protein [Alphaproteobacteria bacterium]
MKIFYVVGMTSLLVSNSLLADSKPSDNRFYKATDSQSVREKKAVILVDESVAFYKKNGKEKTIAEMKNRSGQFCAKYDHGYQGISILTQDGVVLASCKYPGLVGSNNIGWKSPNGNFFVEDVLKEVNKKPQGVFTASTITSLNPITGNPSASKVYAKEEDGLVFMTQVVEDSPLHRTFNALEDLEKAQDPKNAKPLK